MFYPASVLLRRFSVYASSHKLLRKELMAFIDFLCHLPAYICLLYTSLLDIAAIFATTTPLICFLRIILTI